MTQQEWEVLNSTMGYSPQQDTAIRESVRQAVANGATVPAGYQTLLPSAASWMPGVEQSSMFAQEVDAFGTEGIDNASTDVLSRFAPSIADPANKMTETKLTTKDADGNETTVIKKGKFDEGRAAELENMKNSQIMAHGFKAGDAQQMAQGFKEADAQQMAQGFRSADLERATKENYNQASQEATAPVNTSDWYMQDGVGVAGGIDTSGWQSVPSSIFDDSRNSDSYRFGNSFSHEQMQEADQRHFDDIIQVGDVYVDENGNYQFNSKSPVPAWTIDAEKAKSRSNAEGLALQNQVWNPTGASEDYDNELKAYPSEVFGQASAINDQHDTEIAKEYAYEDKVARDTWYPSGQYEEYDNEMGGYPSDIFDAHSLVNDRQDAEISQDRALDKFMNPQGSYDEFGKEDMLEAEQRHFDDIIPTNGLYVDASGQYVRNKGEPVPAWQIDSRKKESRDAAGLEVYGDKVRDSVFNPTGEFEEYDDALEGYPSEVNPITKEVTTKKETQDAVAEVNKNPSTKAMIDEARKRIESGQNAEATIQEMLVDAEPYLGAYRPNLFKALAIAAGALLLGAEPMAAFGTGFAAVGQDIETKEALAAEIAKEDRKTANTIKVEMAKLGLKAPAKLRKAKQESLEKGVTWAQKVVSDMYSQMDPKKKKLYNHIDSSKVIAALGKLSDLYPKADWFRPQSEQILQARAQGISMWKDYVKTTVKAGNTPKTPPESFIEARFIRNKYVGSFDTTQGQTITIPRSYFGNDVEATQQTARVVKEEWAMAKSIGQPPFNSAGFSQESMWRLYAVGYQKYLKTNEGEEFGKKNKVGGFEKWVKQNPRGYIIK